MKFKVGDKVKPSARGELYGWMLGKGVITQINDWGDCEVKRDSGRTVWVEPDEIELLPPSIDSIGLSKKDIQTLKQLNHEI